MLLLLKRRLVWASQAQGGTIASLVITTNLYST